MKINLQNSDEFDDFFKKKYANDSIKPSPELWTTIHQKTKFSNISTNYQSISMLKIAVSVLAVALISTIIYFEISINKAKTGNTESDNKIKNISIIERNESSNTLNNRNIDLSENDQIYNKVINEKMNNLRNNDVHEISKNVYGNGNPIKAKDDDKQYSIKKDKLTKMNLITENKIKTNINLIDKQDIGLIGDSLTMAETLSEDIDTTSAGVYIYNNKCEIYNYDSLPFTHTIVKNDNLININENQTKKNKLNKGSEKKHNKGKFSLNINVSPQYSFRTLQNNVSYMIPDIGEKYFNEHEKGNFSYSTGLQLLYTLNKKWEISGGLEYSRYSQSIGINGFDLKTDNQNDYYVYTSIGKDDLIINSSVPVNDSEFLKSSKIYSFINIPLGLEYYLINNFFITGGISYNHLLTTDVNWQAEDFNGDFSIITNNITGIKRSNFSFSIGAAYKKIINSKLSLVINPQFTAFITSFTREMPVKTYPYTLGIKFGLRYKI